MSPSFFSIAACILILLMLCAGVWLGLWLRRTRPWAGPRTRYPVLLIHGVLGFDEIFVGKNRFQYFRGIIAHLEGLGVTVHRPRLPPLSSIADRAKALVEAAARLPGKKFNIIAHSMGGLDARYAISRLGLKERVASLVTIGTPHHGTPLASLGSALLGEKYGLARLLKGVGVEVAAVFDLTPERMKRFNQQIRDERGVFYACVTAAVDEGSENMSPLLKLTYLYLKRTGPNDGLVPLASQTWGLVLDDVKADHWVQIGWGRGLDAPRLYEALLFSLRKRGF